jgi:ferric-dicitrate binding protein FerR (iron transport regulator)
MRNHCLARRRAMFAANLLAAVVIGSALAGSRPASAAGACALAPSDRDPSLKMLQCRQELTVRPAKDAQYRPLYKKGQQVPAAIQLNGGALLMEFHPASPQDKFQILTPLAIAAVRGTRWAVDVTPAQTSTLVLEGTVAVTNRRLNKYVLLTDGQGVDITPGDTTVTEKQWGEVRVRALLARFGE